jgi:YHS domain-containing protein
VSQPKAKDNKPPDNVEPGPGKPEKKPAEKPTPTGVTDLANTVDPVSGANVTDPAAFTADWKGFRAHFADAGSVTKFKDDPIRYSAKLGLALDSMDDVHKVDPSTFRMPVLPEECPFCGQEPNPDVYILHRNFKIFFG